jgi:hypothetical protein
MMLIFLLVATPLAYASVHDFTVFVFAICCALNFYLTVIVPKARIPFNPFVILGLFFIAVACLQLVSGHSAYPWATAFDLIKFISYSLVFLSIITRLSEGQGERSSSETRRSIQNILRLGCLTGCLSIFFHSIYDFNSHITANAFYFSVLLSLACGPGSRGEEYGRVFFKRITDTIIWTGLIIAVFAIVQKFSFNGHIFWIGMKAADPVGPYYNYDHYAGFMELCTPLAIASAVAHINHTSYSSCKSWVEKVLWFSTSEAHQTLRYIFFAMIMTATVFMSTSRGGIMSFCVTQLIFFAIIICKTAHHERGRRALFVFGTIAALVSIFVLWLGPEDFLQRFQLTSIDKIVKMEGPDAARLMFYRDTISMIKDKPVLGAGLGTFGSAFAPYRKFDLNLGYLRYAHNDYLQLLAEMGIVAGGIIILGFLILFIREYYLCIRQLE